MSCIKQHGPATYADIYSKLTGKKMTGEQWHELKKIADEAGMDTGRSKVDEATSREAAEALVASLLPPERLALLPQEQQDALKAEIAAMDPHGESGNTAGTIAAVRLLAERGPDVLDEAQDRIRAARAEKEGKEAPKSTGKQGTDIPPLVAEIQQGRKTYRFYAIDPQTKAQLEMGFLTIDDALRTGKAFPSITTVLPKGDFSGWAAGLAADYGDEVIERLSEMDEDERNAFIAELQETDPKTGKTAFRKKAAGAYLEKRDKAAIRGTDAHALAEAISRGENPDVPEELQGYVDAARKFNDQLDELRAKGHDVKFIYTEATVYNPDSRTMGTTDGILEIDGKRYVYDYKTNKNAAVYPTTGMQLAAAANATAIVNADGSQTPMPKIDGGIGIGLGPTGDMNIFYFETEKGGVNDEGFKAAREQWQWNYETDNRPRGTSISSIIGI